MLRFLMLFALFNSSQFFFVKDLKKTFANPIHPAGKYRASGINFIENSWSAALKKASAEKKLIFVDAYAVWCAPCRQLKATTFRDPGVAAFFNSNFVNLSMDMEKGEGVMLSEKWGVNEFPTLIILDHKGNVVSGNVGFMKPEELIRFGNKSLNKIKAGS